MGYTSSFFLRHLWVIRLKWLALEKLGASDADFEVKFTQKMKCIRFNRIACDVFTSANLGRGPAQRGYSDCRLILALGMMCMSMLGEYGDALKL